MLANTKNVPRGTFFIRLRKPYSFQKSFIDNKKVSIHFGDKPAMENQGGYIVYEIQLGIEKCPNVPRGT